MKIKYNNLLIPSVIILLSLIAALIIATKLTNPPSSTSWSYRDIEQEAEELKRGRRSNEQRSGRVSREEKNGLFLYECDFKKHDCGIVNAVNMESFFRYKMTTIANRTQPMLVLNSRSCTTNGARLKSAYFHTHNHPLACLTLDYYMNGTGIQLFEVTQQDKLDSKLWKSNFRIDNWERAQIDVELSRGEPRFFFTAEIEPGAKGDLALAKVQFTYGVCKR
jgi:hypothetical protein